MAPDLVVSVVIGLRNVASSVTAAVDATPADLATSAAEDTGHRARWQPRRLNRTVEVAT